MNTIIRAIPLCIGIVAVGFGAAGQKHTEGTERVVDIRLVALWTEGQTNPDSVAATATVAVKATNDADAAKIATIESRSVEFSALRTDRSITLPGVGALTYQQVTRALALMTKDAADRPQVPTLTTATPGNAQVVLGWGASARAASYTVKRGTVSGGPYSNVATGVVQTSYTDATAQNGTTYYYVVAAVNPTGPSDNSDQLSARPSAN